MYLVPLFCRIHEAMMTSASGIMTMMDAPGNDTGSRVPSMMP